MKFTFMVKNFYSYWMHCLELVVNMSSPEYTVITSVIAGNFLYCHHEVNILFSSILFELNACTTNDVGQTSCPIFIILFDKRALSDVSTEV